MKYLFILLNVLLFFSCKKDKTNNNTPVPEPCYQKFIGSYKVHNIDSNTFYTMSITNQINFAPNGNEIDTLIITNFANMFNLKTQFKCTYDSNNGMPNDLDIGVHDSTYDFKGHRWYLFPLFQDSLGNKTSWLQNDTLNVYFYMCNIKFYIYEAQPYFCKNVMHIAVKQH